jgi:hypothetical protein
MRTLANIDARANMYALWRREALQYPANAEWPPRRFARAKAILALARWHQETKNEDVTFGVFPKKILRVSGNLAPGGDRFATLDEDLDAIGDRLRTGDAVKPTLPRIINKRRENPDGSLQLTINKWWLQGSVDKIPLVTPRGRIACHLQLICGWMADNAERDSQRPFVRLSRLLKRTGARDWYNLERGLTALNECHRSKGLPQYEMYNGHDGVRICFAEQDDLPDNKTHAEVMAACNRIGTLEVVILLSPDPEEVRKAEREIQQLKEEYSL